MVDYDIVDTIPLHTVEVGDMVRLGDEDFSVERVLDLGDTITLELQNGEGEDDSYTAFADHNIQLLGINHTEDD